MMERGGINVIIFDEEEPSAKDHRESRTVLSSKQAGPSSSHHIDIIEQEIHYLTDKIRSLQQQADALAQVKNESNANYKQSTASIDITPGHSQEVVMAIEKKIQIIVRETRKLVDRLGDSFQKKIQAKISKKYDESGISKIKENYSCAIRKIEEGYKKQIERVNREHKDVESRMMSRVTAVQQKLLNRINEFEIKEKQYVDWIHHLEIQLKEKPKEQKSKRMIEVTHAPNAAPEKIVNKKENSDNSSILTGENYSGLQQQRYNSQVSENSKIQRRHRIFDTVGGKNSSSVSPNTKVVSPISPISAQPNVHSSKIINPLNKQQKSDVQPESQRRNTEVAYQIDKPALVIDRMTEPMKNNYTNDRESSPWKVMDTCSVEKSHLDTKRNQLVKDVNEDEFYRDVPRANQGWQRFQDYQENEDSSSDSQEDVIFYRNEDRRSDWEPGRDSKWKRSSDEDFIESKRQVADSKRQVAQSKRPGVDPRNEERVFSPFDLN